MSAQNSRLTVKKIAAAALAIGLVPVAGTTIAAGTAGAQDNAENIKYEKATAEQRVVKTDLADGRMIISIWSPSMEKEVPNIVQAPKKDGRGNQAPVSYLVNGAGGGEDAATWQAQSDVKDFMSSKDAWTVTPIGGAFSYYTDWQAPDPNVDTEYASADKPMRFETYLAKELPAQFEAWLNANQYDAPVSEPANKLTVEIDNNRKRALSAISMTATSVITIAENHPGVFQFIGSYSGCAETSTPIGHQAIEIVTGMRGGANLDNMWGPYPGDGWTNNDPVVNAWKLKEQGANMPAMYITTGNGLPGPYETLDNPRLKNSGPALANQAIVGGVIEAATNYCTANLGRRFNELGIPGDKAQFNFKPNGTHSWGYWQDDLHESWPRLSAAIGA
ncbi:alpha/beta hydrolase [Dietzia sp.]|uniref:alpha/beta hydrolase n=1 Tax=Dietzia sp. TaxID=1871616 RepID=UPI002FD8CDB1